MNRYNPEAKCPKCGCTGIKNVFIAKDDWMKLNPAEYYNSGGEVIVSVKSLQDHINRECFNCGFLWNELPLDTEIIK